MKEKKKFRLFDAVLAAVCIVLVVESVVPAASIGSSQFFWWFFLLLGFFLPYGMISSELGTTYEDEGGICDWVRRAFGQKWGARVAWYYYINFPLWMGSLAVLFSDVLFQLLGRDAGRVTVTVIRLLFIWCVVFVSSFRVSDSKWILNSAAVSKAAILLLLGGLGIRAALTQGIANDFSFSALLPSFDGSSISNLSVILFNFLGFEVVTTFASDMENPDREIPRAIVVGGLMIAFFYLFAAFGISAAVPYEELSASSGLLDSFSLLLGEKAKWVLIPIGIAFLYTLAANLISWSLGVNYVAQVASERQELPRLFSLTGKKNGMPLGAGLMNGAIASAIVIAAPFVPSQDVFWSFFALNMVMLLFSYLPVFPAFYKLRKTDPDRERPFRVKGGKGKLLLICFLPMILLGLSVFFSVVPLSFDKKELGEKLPILIGTALSLGIGEIIAARAGKSKRKDVSE